MENCVSFLTLKMIGEFTHCFQTVKFYLRLIGLAPDTQDGEKNIFERLCNHPIYTIYFFSLGLEVIAQLQWFREAVNIGKSFLEITFILPCLTLCVLSMFKSFCTLTYAHCVNDLLQTLDMMMTSGLLSLGSEDSERHALETKLSNTHTSILNNISKCMKHVIIVGVLMFSLFAPLLLMLTYYYNTGEVEYILPLLGSYPFDVQDLKYYLCIYVHQVWTTLITIYFVYAPNYLYITCSTFIHVQFLLLHYDMERVVPDVIKNTDYDSYKRNFRELVRQHIELIRCVELLEKIFSKSILVNALTSSIIICVTGFNVMINDNIVTMASFASFLSFNLIQIFLYCYNGDNIMRSSIQVSDAIYNSRWYRTDAKEWRSFFIVLIRAQRPCKITAYNFFDINLGAFTSILSTSWSYFALLKTMYNPDSAKPE